MYLPCHPWDYVAVAEKLIDVLTETAYEISGFITLL